MTEENDDEENDDEENDDEENVNDVENVDDEEYVWSNLTWYSNKCFPLLIWIKIYPDHMRDF